MQSVGLIHFPILSQQLSRVTSSICTVYVNTVQMVKKRCCGSRLGSSVLFPWIRISPIRVKPVSESVIKMNLFGVNQILSSAFQFAPKNTHTFPGSKRRSVCESRSQFRHTFSVKEPESI